MYLLNVWLKFSYLDVSVNWGVLALMGLARGMQMFKILSKEILMGLAWGHGQISKWACHVIYLNKF
jgi:hypothetical protein